MYLVPFFRLFPEVAEKETRTLTTFDNFDAVPPGEYALVESYCPDPACDCRRVMLNVFGAGQGRMLAAISYGFDRDEELAGPFLDMLNPQSEYAETLLEMVQKFVLSDRSYVARLESHYRLVKEAAADPSHPIHERLRQLEEGPEEKPARRRKRKAGLRRRRRRRR